MMGFGLAELMLVMMAGGQLPAATTVTVSNPVLWAVTHSSRSIGTLGALMFTTRMQSPQTQAIPMPHHQPMPQIPPPPPRRAPLGP